MILTDDRAKETTTTTGTGNLTLAGAVSKFFSLTSGLAIGSIVMYSIVHQTSAEHEHGIGRCSSATVFERLHITRSSNANAAVNFTAGTKDVFYGLTSSQLWQSDLSRRLYFSMSAQANTTTATLLGGTNTTLGTSTARAVATTSSFTRKKRLGYVSAATAGALCGVRSANGYITTGNAAGLGGFIFHARVGRQDANTATRTFYGVSGIAAPTNVQPSTLTNVIGVGHGSADTNLKLFYGGSAAQTPIDLGANFPVNTANVDMYSITIIQPTSNNDKFLWEVVRLNTGHIASGVVTGTAGTAIPANTTLLGHQLWRTNNATAVAVGIDIALITVIDTATG